MTLLQTVNVTIPWTLGKTEDEAVGILRGQPCMKDFALFRHIYSPRSNGILGHQEPVFTRLILNKCLPRH